MHCVAYIFVKFWSSSSILVLMFSGKYLSGFGKSFIIKSIFLYLFCPRVFNLSCSLEISILTWARFCSNSGIIGFDKKPVVFKISGIDRHSGSDNRRMRVEFKH